MSDKRQVKRSIRQLRRIKSWQLAILLILAVLVAATFLRLNNIGMIERRDAVLAADKEGNIADIKNNLVALQRYSAAHMNASSGVIYLEESYKRDVRLAIERAETSSGGSENINAAADRACKHRFSGYSQAYVQCFASELAKIPAGTVDEPRAELPKPELYRHDFVSPPWSPDFAGWSVLACVIITGVILLRLLALALLKAILKYRSDDI